MGQAKYCTPTSVYVKIKTWSGPFKVHQYCIPHRSKKRITPHIRQLLDLGVLKPMQSSWNIPLLPVKKSYTNDYRPVQNLREVNKIVFNRKPIVPNPYILHNLVQQQYIVLDLKDALFSLPLVPKRQLYFAFECHDPEIGVS